MRNSLKSLRGAAIFASAVLVGVLGVAGAQSAAVTPTADANSIITILPKGKEATPAVNAANVSLKVDGKEAPVTSLRHFDNTHANLQLLLLIDDSARSSLGLYLKEMSDFITALPPNVEIGVAYIQNGGAHFVQQFTTDHAGAATTLHLPASPPGANVSPYFAITALAKAWPGNTTGVRHEVVMISNGVDGYFGLRYDPDDPYVNTAITEAQKNGLVIYSIYFKDRGLASRLGAGVNSGQNYLIQMSEATGGELYYQGFDNPVSFVPFFGEINRNLQNQYEVGMTVPPRVKDGLRSLKVKVNVPNTKVSSPATVLIGEPNPKK